MGGNIGVATSNGSSPQLTVGSQDQLDINHTLFAPSISVGNLAQVGAVDTNSLTNNGGQVGTQSSYPSPMPPLPAVFASTPGSTNVTVAQGHQTTLSPGSFGTLTDDGQVFLNPGTYSFASVTLGNNAQLIAQPNGFTSVLIAGTLSTGTFAQIQPVGQPANALTISVSGSDGTGGPAVSLGANTQVISLLAAPNGTVSLSNNVQATGAYSGLNCTAGNNVVLNFQSGFANATFNLVYPAGYGISRVAIAASQGMLLGVNDKVLATNGSPGTVTNAGSGLVTVGSGTTTGSIVSVGNILLVPSGVSASSAQSAGTVNVGLGDHVGSVAQNATLTPLAYRTITVPQLPGTPAEVLAAPGSTTLAPGLYDNVNILSGATVTLTAGNYVINNFILSPLSTLNLDTSAGAVNVFVMSTALWNGQVTGDGTQFVFSYLGILPLTFAGKFTGTALAPNALINLGPLPTSYSGNFYGQQVAVASGVTVQEIATPLLIASLTLSTTTLCTGQQTEVTVDAADAGAGARVGINGVPGAHQFVEYPGLSGSRVVYASVVTPNGQADFASVPVTMQSCTLATGALPPVALHFWPDPTLPNQVAFMVHDYNSNGQEVLPTVSATYAWTFGDGQTATTSSPLVSHNYSASINPMLAYNYFQASVTVTASGGSTSAQKVVPIFSVYADNRSRGIVQPPSTAAPSGNNLVLTVTNYETTPLSITGARVDLLPCDPSLDPVQQPVTSLSTTVPASTTSTVNIPQPQAFSADTCAMGIHLFGTAAAGAVYSDTYALVQENTLIQQPVTDPTSIAVLNQASAYTADPNNFNLDELRQLYVQGILTQLPAPVPAGSTYGGSCAGLAVGCTCQPGQVAPSGIALACQPTADWVENPGAVINAFKGDFIISHACTGMIAALLKTVQQEYSHSMTVSKNQVEIRHSTASESRMEATINGSPSAASSADQVCQSIRTRYNLGFLGLLVRQRTVSIRWSTAIACRHRVEILIPSARTSAAWMADAHTAPPGSGRMHLRHQHRVSARPAAAARRNPNAAGRRHAGR